MCFLIAYPSPPSRAQANELSEVCPELELVVFTDRDIAENSPRVAAALETADAFFASLVFDYDNVSFRSEVNGHGCDECKLLICSSEAA